jgi:hypothetical protein
MERQASSLPRFQRPEALLNGELVPPNATYHKERQTCTKPLKDEEYVPKGL